MTVLYILGTLLVIFLIFVLIEQINQYSTRHYLYEFFTWENLTITAVGYLVLFWGGAWYAQAITKDGDVLNGIILMSIGVLILVGLLIAHIKNTTFLFGFWIGVLQLLLYIPGALAGIFVFAALTIWLADTKPVINLN